MSFLIKKALFSVKNDDFLPVIDQDDYIVKTKNTQILKILNKAFFWHFYENTHNYPEIAKNGKKAKFAKTLTKMMITREFELLNKKHIVKNSYPEYSIHPI